MLRLPRDSTLQICNAHIRAAVEQALLELLMERELYALYTRTITYMDGVKMHYSAVLLEFWCAGQAAQGRSTWSRS